MNCEEIEELAGAYALGALDADERAAVDAHLATCDKHPEMAGLQTAAASLALAADELEPSAALKSRLMAALGTTRPDAPPAAERRSLGDTIRGWFATPRLAYGLSAALTIAVVGLLAWNVSLQGGSSEQVVANVSGSGTGQVIYLKDQHLAVMDLHGLAPLPEGKVYEVWSMTATSATRLGNLAVAGSDGNASLPYDGSGTQIGVTVEDAPGVDQPTMQPILAATVS